ncbi:MAG: hypothetical protein HUU10_13790 [Bacteroidetes bacterium]|nr:hypothetical protein [Bacteroidota bacterium]
MNFFSKRAIFGLIAAFLILTSGLAQTPASTQQTLRLGSGWLLLSAEPAQPIDLPFFTGPAGQLILQTSFDTPDLINKTVILRSAGINFQSRLYLNDQLIVLHPGGYLPLEVPIPSEFFNGPVSVLRIEMETSPDYKGTVPLISKPGGPRPVAGIFSVPELVISGPVSIGSVSPAYSISGDQVVFSPTVRLRVSQAFGEGEKPVSVRVTVSDSTGKMVWYDQSMTAGSASAQTGELRFPTLSFAGPQWKPSAPSVQRVSVTVSRDTTIIDQADLFTGFRQLTALKNAWVIGTDTLKIKGVEYYNHHRSADALAAARKDLLAMKRAGVNTVRFAGYPPTHDVLALCDSLGLMVFSGLPVSDVPVSFMSDPGYQQVLANQATRQLETESLHPSVVAFSLGGPVLSTSDLSWYNEWGQLIAGSWPHLKPAVTIPAGELVPLLAPGILPFIDVTGLNLQETRQFLTDFSDDRPSLITGLGIQFNPANHQGYADPYSVQHQAKYLMDTWPLIRDSKQAAGAVIRSWNDKPAGAVSMKSGFSDDQLVYTGLVSSDGQVRPAMDYLKSLFAGEVVFNPSVGRFQNDIQVVFPVVGVLIIFFFSFLYSSNRRFKDNLTRSFVRSFNFFSDVREQRVMLGFQSLGLLIMITATFASLLISVLYAFRNDSSVDFLLSILLPWESIRSVLIGLVWNPVVGILSLSGLIVLILIIGVGIGIAFAWLFRTRVGFSQVMIAMTWSSTPVLLLVPVPMIFEQVAGAGSDWIWLTFLVIGLVLIWLFFRILKGLSVILMSGAGKVYLSGLLLLVAAVALTVFHYHYHYQAFAYWDYWVNTVRW